MELCHKYQILQLIKPRKHRIYQYYQRIVYFLKQFYERKKKQILLRNYHLFKYLKMELCHKYQILQLIKPRNSLFDV
jgi:hypothetical protein